MLKWIDDCIVELPRWVDDCIAEQSARLYHKADSACNTPNYTLVVYYVFRV